MNQSAKMSGAVLLVLIGLVFWYFTFADYDYGALAGTCTFNGAHTRHVLVLRENRSYTQTVLLDGVSTQVQGTWHRYGASHVSFSRNFITLPGEQVNAIGEAHGEFDKTLGVLPVLTLAPIPGGPQLCRNLLR